MLLFECIDDVVSCLLVTIEGDLRFSYIAIDKRACSKFACILILLDSLVVLLELVVGFTFPHIAIFGIGIESNHLIEVCNGVVVLLKL